MPCGSPSIYLRAGVVCSAQDEEEKFQEGGLWVPFAPLSTLFVY